MTVAYSDILAEFEARGADADSEVVSHVNSPLCDDPVSEEHSPSPEPSLPPSGPQDQDEGRPPHQLLEMRRNLLLAKKRKKKEKNKQKKQANKLLKEQAAAAERKKKKKQRYSLTPPQQVYHKRQQLLKLKSTRARSKSRQFAEVVSQAQDAAVHD